MSASDLPTNVIRVGIGVMVWRDGKVLIGKRRGSHGEGQFGFPGGHVEYMESIEECARREVREECGLEVANVRFMSVHNQKAHAPWHYINFGMAADWVSGEAQVLEPDRMVEWAWYSPEQLPSPLFDPIPSYFEGLRTGQVFFDV